MQGSFASASWDWNIPQATFGLQHVNNHLPLWKALLFIVLSFVGIVTSFWILGLAITHNYCLPGISR